MRYLGVLCALWLAVAGCGGDDGGGGGGGGGGGEEDAAAGGGDGDAGGDDDIDAALNDAPAPDAGCSQADCTGGQICTDGDSACRACVDDDEDDLCGTGRACIAGACTPGACHDTDQCPVPNTCLPNNQCGCTSSATCAGGICAQDACRPCEDTPDCVDEFGAGYVCGDDGACVPA